MLLKIATKNFPLFRTCLVKPFSSSDIEKKLTEMMGCEFPVIGKPIGAYIPATMHNGQLHTSGQLPFKSGKLIATGKVGKEVDEATAMECAKLCTFHCLNVAKSVIGDLSKIEKILKVNVYVNSAPEYNNQQNVANGASEILVKAFGDKGKHARAAIGAAGLPMNTPVEVDMVLAIKDH